MPRLGSLKTAALAALLIVPAGLSGLTGCKKKDAAETGGGSAAATGGGGESVTLNASGATFQKAAQEITIEAFAKAHPNIKVNYAGGGSGKGRKEFADGVVDFACTDAPYKPDDAKNTKGEFFYIPNVLGAITLSYHLEGVDKLQLSPDVIAKIFQREIKKWNDPAIAADNPDAKLPDVDIVVARRADGSGTTENFTKYLMLATGETWKLQSGATVEWPGDTQAGNGNNGVALIVKKTNGAIGYVDLSDAKANSLVYAAVKNQAGKFVLPTAEGVTASGDGIEVDDQLLFSALNAAGDAAYPITAQSWCIVYAKQSDRAKGNAVKAYFKFLITDAQKLLPEIDFAPIPKSLQDKALVRIEKIQVP